MFDKEYNINDLSWLDDEIISKINLPLHHNIERMINYCLRKILKDNYENSKLIFNFYLPFTEIFVQDYQSEAHHDCSCINFDIVETIFRDTEKYLYKKMKKQNIPYKRIEFDKFILLKWQIIVIISNNWLCLFCNCHVFNNSTSYCNWL